MSTAPRPPRNRNPLALDVASFCRDAGLLEGEWAHADLPRLAECVVRGADGFAEAAVRWSAQGRLEQSAARASQCVLDLRIDTVVVLECQRCLQPLAQTLSLERRFRFVHGEDEAARLDEEVEEDVLALTPRLDLRALAEDELLLSLPLVPRHEACPSLPEVLRPGAEAALGEPKSDASGGPVREFRSAGPAQAPGEAADKAATGKPHPFAALEALRDRKR